MKKLFSLCLLSCAIFASAQAVAHWTEDEDEDCGRFHINIYNSTPVTCVLITQVVTSGVLTNALWASILPNGKDQFDMWQNGWGPEITLTYQCGTENISFTSKQNVCMLEAGDITGTILHPLPTNINASYTVLTGSFIHGKGGNIDWKILPISPLSSRTTSS
jgi:hypothetical protein